LGSIMDQVRNKGPKAIDLGHVRRVLTALSDFLPLVVTVMRICYN
jgi:hypothetical protein